MVHEFAMKKFKFLNWYTPPLIVPNSQKVLMRHLMESNLELKAKKKLSKSLPKTAGKGRRTGNTQS